MARKRTEDELERSRQAQQASARADENLPPPLRELPGQFQAGQRPQAPAQAEQPAGTAAQLPPALRDLPQGMPTLPQSMAGTDPAATMTGPTQPTEGTIIGKNEIMKAADTLREYKNGKENLERRIIENEQWYKTRHWDYINRKHGGKRAEVEPTSAWLFNALANKHADVMDNYPSPVILPRERNDEQAAKTLSSVLPVIVERCDFERTYSDTGWDELKSGTCVLGAFWNPELENGLGDIDIKGIDLLNIFWQPGITDIQQSRNLFIVSMVDDDLLAEQYPEELGGKLHTAGTIDVADYIYDDTVDTGKKSAVIDWYYKRRSAAGNTILHYCKFAGDSVLFASENDPAYQERGWYDHGRYPVEFDVMFPDKGTPCGFGFVDIMRDAQLYVDKLNQVLIRNALMVGKARYFIKNSGGVNLEEFSDLSKDFVHVEGNLTDENLRQIEVAPLPDEFQDLLAFKVNELKETSGNRDFNQGSSASGVTAAAAIAALQEAGNKLSRDMLKGRYRAYRGIITLCIELIRQFYDEEREFRITGDRGQTQFTTLSNAGLQDQIMPPAVPGEDLQAGYEPSVRRPIFDVVVKAEKTNPFSRASQNEFAKELYSMGFFNPQMADQSLAALELMDFEGKEKVEERVSQGQTLLSIVMQQQAEMQKMALIIQATTGVNMGGGQESTSASGGGAATKSGGASSASSGGASGQTQTTAYAEALAKRSVPDMSRVNQGVKIK